jgi:hypothetical protein
MNGAIMKTLFHTPLKFAAVSLLLVCAGATAAKAQGARLQLSHLDYLAAKASETVDVNVDERLMQLTAKVFSDKDSDEAAVKELVKGLKGIYVKSFEFEHEGEYSTADVESIRSQLRGPGWSRILSVNSKKDGDVEVYLMTNGDQIGGLAVLATDPKELTVVNIIGPIDLDKLSKLEGQFGVPDLGIEQPTKPKPKN